MVSAIHQGVQVPEEDLNNLQTILDFINGLDTTDTGVHIREGIAQGMTEAGFDSDAETVATNLETAMNTALQIESPSTALFKNPVNSRQQQTSPCSHWRRRERVP